MEIGKDDDNGNNDEKVYDKDDVGNIWDDGTTIQDFYAFSDVNLNLYVFAGSNEYQKTQFIEGS